MTALCFVPLAIAVVLLVLGICRMSGDIAQAEEDARGVERARRS